MTPCKTPLFSPFDNMLRLGCSFRSYPGPDWRISLKILKSCLLSGLQLGLGLNLLAAELRCCCFFHHCKTRGACCRWSSGIQESSSGPKFFHLMRYCLLEPCPLWALMKSTSNSSEASSSVLGSSGLVGVDTLPGRSDGVETSGKL